MLNFKYVDLAFGILYLSMSNFGWGSIFSLLQIFKYTCFSPSGYLKMYNFVSHCRSFKVTATQNCLTPSQERKFDHLEL
jgi:hypothetical protein